MKHLLLITSFFFILIAYSQDIKNVDFTFKNNSFYITYDLLNCHSNTLYDVKLSMEGKQSGYYTPINISGDLMNQTCGTNKKIIWSPLAEGKQLKEEVRFYVSIKNKKKEIENGPSNALRSILLPGLGSLKVQSTKLPLIATAGFIISGIQILRYNSLTNSNYENYLSALNQNDLNNYFEAAKDARTKTYIYSGIAVGIWVSDIIYTIIKGNKNKALHQKSANNLGNNWKFNFNADPRSVNLSLKKEF